MVVGLAFGLILGFGGGWLGSEYGDRLTSAAGPNHREIARDLRARLVTAEARLARAEADVTRLSGDLEGSLAREQVVTDNLAVAREALEAARAGSPRRTVAEVPEGVRRCVQALHRLFRDDGVVGLRFLGVRAVGERELLGVELLDHDPGSLTSRIFVAERMWATVERGEGAGGLGRLELRLFEGTVSHGGRLEAIPEEGWPMVVANVDGRSWERALPYLVRTVGTYPDDEEHVPRQDPAVVFQWRERLRQLLGLADGDTEFRLKDLRSVQGTVLGGVALGGYRKHALVLYAEGKSAEVVVDSAAQLVFLDLRRGVVRDAASVTEVGASGYRLLLPGVTPDQARRTMMGLVVEKP